MQGVMLRAIHKPCDQIFGHFLNLLPPFWIILWNKYYMHYIWLTYPILPCPHSFCMSLTPLCMRFCMAPILERIYHVLQRSLSTVLGHFSRKTTWLNGFAAEITQKCKRVSLYYMINSSQVKMEDIVKSTHNTLCF